LQGELLESEGGGSISMLDYRRAMFLDPRDPLPVQQLAKLRSIKMIWKQQKMTSLEHGT
jgi:hypothetical protein